MPSPFGTRLKHYRRLRSVSQLDLSLQSGVSPRHMSFIETGRSRPGRDVILRVANALSLGPRDQNDLLRAAGFPPAYGERALTDDELAPFRAMLGRMLTTHEPFPALIVTAWWDLVDANEAARHLMQGLPPPGGDGPLNLIDALLAPGPARDRFVDYPRTAHALVDRLSRDATMHPDPRLHAVLERARERVEAIPRPASVPHPASPAITTRLRIGDRVISTITAIARFSDVQDATLDDLRVEMLYPADDASERFFRELAG